MASPVRVGVNAVRWQPYEVMLHGPTAGNPFVEVALRAEFRTGERTLTAHGFYDGDGVYRVRIMPDEQGRWTFRTISGMPSLDGRTGAFDCLPAGADDHGSVRVCDQFHFQHADATRYLPVGTTMYAWTHQPVELEEQTLATLAGTPFNKVRMCVFPKSYRYNTNEPVRYPFEDGDVLRPNPEFFRHLERRVGELGALGIEADVILFHPYDRWGYAAMGAAADDRYIRYVVARLAAFPNVWWSMANEYDLVTAKSDEDWNRLAELVRSTDPHGHLLSIHNWTRFWDNGAPWVTHASMQRVDVYRTTENVGVWRAEWGKPVVVDECGYEGDIEQGWGNLNAQELVRRCWEGTVRGGYVGHGETYLADDEVLWWSKGGVLKGESPARIAFLRAILEDAPGAGIDPQPSPSDVPIGGVADRWQLAYFGFNQPRLHTFTMEPGTRVAGCRASRSPGPPPAETSGVTVAPGSSGALTLGERGPQPDSCRHSRPSMRSQSTRPPAPRTKSARRWACTSPSGVSSTT
ncbi:MAG: DUF5060 domain-containing protein [Dactylosporangium sp.]|nr:DUF5060 domain-containing protein [Dactylosporangium sp.]